MAERQRRAAELGGHAVERTPAMSTAHVAAVHDTVLHEGERRGLVPHDPLDAEAGDLRLQGVDVALELSLLDGDRDEVVGERRARTIREERVEQTETVLAA